MNILHLSTRIKIGYGGGEKFLEEFLKNFNNEKHVFLGRDPVVFQIFKKLNLESYNSPGGFEPITFKRKLLIPLSFILGFLQVIRFYKLFRNADIIIISASSIAETIFGIPWVKLFFPKKRIIQFMHAMCIEYYYKNPLTFLLRKSLNSIEMVFVSNSQYLDWKNQLLTGKKNYVIYNGVKIFKEPIVNENSLDIIKIGYLGRIYYQKGIVDLMEALNLLKDTQKIILTLVGKGESLEELKSFSKKMNLDKNITIIWKDFEPNPENFYSTQDVLIFPSWVESFGLVLLESWERGVPVITSDIPSFKELKEFGTDLEKKLVFKVHSAVDLHKTIIDFIKNKKEYTSLENKKQLHDIIKNTFSREISFKKYQDLLSNKLAANS